MKNKLNFVLILFVIIFASCNNNKTNSDTLTLNANESGDVWDTMSVTTTYPITLVTRVEMEIKDNHDTTILRSEKLLKLKNSGSYNQYCAYTESLLTDMLLSEKVPAGYCLDITVLASKRGFADRNAVVVSYAVKKIVNHMGG